MLKQTLMLCAFLLFTQIVVLKAKNSNPKSRYVSPYDLMDDARAALDELTQLILGGIQVAHDQLEDMRFDVMADRINVRMTAAVNIQLEHQLLDEELTSIKNLAQTAGADISVCLGDREIRLSQLPGLYLDQVYDCVAQTEAESDKVINGSIYNVDVIYTKVSSLDFQLGRCSPRDFNCISAVMNQIEAATDDLPAEIDVQVDTASKSVEIVKVKIQECADTGLADYVHEGSTIVSEISNCVDAIIS